MSSWVRKDEPPKILRHTLVVDTAEFPELAAFLWSLPWGKGASTIRTILSDAVKAANASASAGASLGSRPTPSASVNSSLQKNTALHESTTAQDQISNQDVDNHQQVMTAEAAARIAEMTGKF